MKRPPDFIIGRAEDPYLRRWWIIPRNRFFNIYLHQFLRSDDDRALHDHPWWNVSIVLRGFYIEHKPDGIRLAVPGAVIMRRATARHRIELINNWACWTLFITGPRIREWGFWCPRGFVLWTDFVHPTDPGLVGPGCGDKA